jgi:hypothetical protein
MTRDRAAASMRSMNVVVVDAYAVHYDAAGLLSLL